MRKRINPTVLFGLVALVIAGWTSSAAAQTAEREFMKHEITGFGGGQIFDLSDEFHDAGAEFEEQVSVGVRYQYNVNPRWAFGGSLLFTPANAEPVRLAGEDVSVDTWYYHGEVTFNLLTRGRIRPYVTGGVGRNLLRVSGGDNENYIGWNFGGGVRIQATRRIGFRVDVRDYVYNADDLEQGSSTALGVPDSFDETIQDLAVTFGVSFGL